MTIENCLIGLLVMILHEAAHIAAALSFGISIKRIGLSWKGMYIVREAGPPLANLITTLAGPLLNLLLAAAWPASHVFALVNMIFGLSNLLPIGGSDGQRAWLQLAPRAPRSPLDLLCRWSWYPAHLPTRVLKRRTNIFRGLDHA
jgi:Zn-dependent protease